ncbi:sensor histidine kinase [Gottschalkiaceae bacterium SANA]|nr:sensor histidine kinase [Gottschalkiaceae bacterium SANA]
MTFRKRILISFCLCISIVFSILMVYVKTSVERNTMAYTEEQTMYAMESKASEVGLWFFTKISEFRVLSELPAFQSMDIRGIKPLIDELASRPSSIESTEFFGVGGINQKIWINGEQTLELIDRSTMLKIKSSTQEFIIDNPQISPYNHRDIFPIYYPILNDKGEKTGILYGGIPTKTLINMLADINQSNGITWIMNQDGVVFTQNESYFYHEVLSQETLKELMNDKTRRQTDVLHLSDLRNMSSTLIYSTIPNTDQWLLCTLLADSEIFAHSNELSRNIAMLWIALLLLTVLISYFLTRSFAQPLEALKANMREVEKGNLVSLPLGNHKDEFYYLEASYNRMLNQISHLIDRIYTEQGFKREAELRALQSQINPHFLYNTLDTLKWIALDYQAYEISDAVNSLSAFFRISLSDGNEMIPLGKELNHARHYMEIQKMRYTEILDYQIEIEPSIQHIDTLKILIQPLVENALYHGLKPKNKKGLISITAYEYESLIFIEVTDNGVGIPSQKLQNIRRNLEMQMISKHYGIYNILERLKLKYGQSAGLTIESIENYGTTATIYYPIENKGGFHHV